MTGASSPSSRDTWALWLRLQRLPGVGVRTRLHLLEHFGAVENIFAASHGQLEKPLAGNRAAIDAILADADETALRGALEWLEQPGHHLLVWTDPDYPPLLRQIPDPPTALYVLGRREALALPQIAVVGSRNPTPAGLENARAFAKSLAEAGLAVTSGLA